MRELPEQLLQRIRSQERLIRFDEQIVAGASFEDLDPALVDQFSTPRTRDDRRLELYSSGGLTNTLTVDNIEYRQASRNRQ